MTTSTRTPGRLRRPRPTDDAGFTLLEVITTCLLASILLGLGVGPFTEYQRKSEHQGAVRTVVAAMRYAQVASVSEGVSYRIDTVDGGKALTVTRMGASASVVRTVRLPNKQLSLAQPTFTVPAGPPERATFYPRGSATPGFLLVTREGSGKDYRVEVEGLTARVSYEE